MTTLRDKPTYRIDDAAGSRPVEPGDFPLAIGGRGADIGIDGDAAAPAAFLGLSEGEVFVQPGGDGTAVVVNGTAVTTSRWLHDGDVLRFDSGCIAVESSGGETRFVVREEDEKAGRAAAPVIVPPPHPPGGARTIEPIHFEPGRKLTGPRHRRAVGPLGVAITLVLAALTAVAVFLLTSRSVRIEVEPAPDRMTLEGGLAFELGGFHLMRPGDYTLRAEKAGFRPLEEDLQVTRDSRQAFRFGFDKLPGRLEVSASVDGAEVLIDGGSAGTTPLAPLELAPGEHEVRLVAERYRDFVARVSIEGGGTTQTLVAELSPRWAEVTFASRPAGALVRLDGEAIGKTPLTAEVLEGRRAYVLALAGYKPLRRELEVAAGEPQQLPAARLEPSDGNLVLTSEPSGATVAVAGVYRGETPLDLYLAPGRDHEVSVSKAGYAARKQSVRVASGETREVDVSLEPEEGEVQISAWPPGAELSVGGEARGEANQTLCLPALPQEIEVSKDGFVPHRQTVTPLPGVPQFLEVTLKPVGQARAEAKAAATPPVYENPEGHELRLIQPGRLRMGASRREPGRRANEVLREVELTRPFYLATREVSNRQLRKFSQDHLSGQVGGHSLEIDHHPAVHVTWDDAARYCNWLSAKEDLPPAYVEAGGKMAAAVPMTTGYRLPTEAEWAWAARYGAGEAPRKYPWGDALPVAAGSGNYADASAAGFLPGALPDYQDGFPATAPVDSFQPDARGLHNLGGNVAEWVHDLYAIRMGGASLERDPRGPAEGEFHVIRGSSYMHSTVTELRLTFRDYGKDPRPDVGFRVARYAE